MLHDSAAYLTLVSQWLSKKVDFPIRNMKSWGLFWDAGAKEFAPLIFLLVLDTLAFSL